MSEDIRLEDLHVVYPGSGEVLLVSRLQLEAGRVTVAAGPSGSGKSTLGHALCGLLPCLGAESSGGLALGEEQLDVADPAAWQGIRGRTVRWIPQDPAAAFTATRKVLPQMLEGMGKDALERYGERLQRLLESLGLPDADVLARTHAFELSGGMLQRAAAVSAFLPGPRLVVADEPTAHLDPPRTLLMARILTTLARFTGTTILWITHDLRLAAAIADRIVMLKEGRVDEEGPAGAVLRPASDTSRPLIEACERLALPLP